MAKGKKASGTKYVSKGERRSVNKKTTKLLAKDRGVNRQFRKEMSKAMKINKGHINYAPFSKATMFS